MSERSRDRLTQAKRYLEKAYLDLEYGFYEWACFTAQQAAEKAVKALYPNGFPEGYPAEYFDRDIAEEAVDAAGDIIGFVESNIGK